MGAMMAITKIDIFARNEGRRDSTEQAIYNTQWAKWKTLQSLENNAIMDIISPLGVCRIDGVINSTQPKSSIYLNSRMFIYLETESIIWYLRSVSGFLVLI